MTMQNLPGTLFGLGLTCLFGTIMIFWVVTPSVIDWQVKKMMRLEEGNEVWEGWSNIEAPIFMNVYLYNVTNPVEIANGALPLLNEIGPYVYEEKRTKLNITVDEDNDTINYKPLILYYFREDLSNGTEEDVITMINVPLVTVASELNEWSRMIRYMAKYYVKSFKETLFLERTVKQALFEGVYSEMIESFSNLLGREYLPNNTFGYMSEKNRTDPEMEIYSGVQDNTRFGQIVSWKGETTLGIWKGDSCNMINGSDNTIFPPFITKERIVRGFETDICRSTHVVYDKDIVHDGINAYRYAMPRDFYSAENSDNECFCKETDKSLCPTNGVSSIAGCKFGAPLYISNPHFLNADQKYIDDIQGMNPNPEIHESYAIFEPTTGIALKGNKRIQINIHLRKSADIAELYNVKDGVVMPLLWIDEDAQQSHKDIEKLRWRMVIPFFLIEIGKWGFLAISSILTAVGVVIFTLRSRSRKPTLYY